MEILEAYDLAGTLRGAALLGGCDHKTVAHDHKTVAHWVAVRDREAPPGVRWFSASRVRSNEWN